METKARIDFLSALEYLEANGEQIEKYFQKMEERFWQYVEICWEQITEDFRECESYVKRIGNLMG